MQWYPVGPAFVFGPRVKDFKRLSRRNERGEQGMVLFIAIDPTDPQTIYTIDRPWWGGRSLFRTRDGGNSWESILDGLVENDVYVAPTCMAINPAHPETLYIGTGWDEGAPYQSFGMYVSHDRGDNWQKLGFNQNVMVNQLLIDPRNAGDLTKAIIVAGTADGVYVSTDGGATWVKCGGTSGFVSSLVADFPRQGNATYYAGIANQGVFYHADDAHLTQSWINLNEQNLGLPPVKNMPFDRILIDLCRANPQRVYAWHFQSGSSVGLYTTSSATTIWIQSAPANKLPSTADDGYYTFAFAVAPNSPGDGKHDVLFFTPRRMARSIDSGNTWVAVPDNPDLWLHEDGHCFAFGPLGNPRLPLFYHGSDGGIGVSTRYADAAFDIAKPFDYNEQLGYDANNGVIQNLNHGHQGSACLSFASHPTLAAMNYIGCQDTGTAGGDGQVWRSIHEADVGQVAAAPGADGIKIWTGRQVPSDLHLNTDKGELWPAGGLVTLDDGGAALSNSYQPINRGFAVGADRNGYAGVFVWDRSTSLNQDVQAGLQWATVASMAHIHKGSLLGIEGEAVQVLDITQTQFQAEFARAHGKGAGVFIQSTTSLTADVMAGANQWVPVASLDELTIGNAVTVGGEAVIIKDLNPQQIAFKADLANQHKASTPVRLVEIYVVRCTHDAKASVISQNFSPDDLRIVAASPVDGNVLYGVTMNNKVWFTNNAKTDNRTTVWKNVTGQGVPSSPPIVALTIDSTGVPYLMFQQPVAGNVTSPLFRFNQDLQNPAWLPQACAQLPKQPRWFGKVVADPVHADTLYAVAASHVYMLTQANAQWTWSDISAGLPRDGGLPKQLLPVELWAVNLGTNTFPKVLLRAAMLGQGVWEADVTRNAVDKNISLYVRDNVLDQGWLIPSPSGIANPYRPAETVEAFQCRDIKFDLIQSGQGMTQDFFQTEPEGSLPLSHVLFEQLHDSRLGLVPLERINVHVQVHNRSHLKANNVSVWAIYANATKGIPLLDARGNMNMPFQFWSQFGQDGRIYPNLPVDSPWRSFGMPVVLSGIDAANPQVATWNWTVPGNFDPFNYCVGIFVHSSVSPLVESSVNLSDFAGQQPQVGQLLIGGLVPYQQPMGIVAQTVKKALVGVRETSNIFVDPLWDPIRGEITFGITVRRFFSSLLLRVTQQSLAGLDRSFSRVHAASLRAVVTRPSQVPPPMRDEIDTSSTGPDPTLSAFRKEGLARIERLRGTLTR